MKIIFLNIDGVLNCQSSKTMYNSIILGIDDDKVKILKKIVDRTNAKIVLCSTWKINWIDKTPIGLYLDKKFEQENLFIFDNTNDNGSNRGEDIINWLSNKNNIESWIVIDDEIFKDYKEHGIIEHLFKTKFYSDNGGLQEEHIDIIVGMLNS